MINFLKLDDPITLWVLDLFNKASSIKYTCTHIIRNNNTTFYLRTFQYGNSSPIWQKVVIFLTLNKAITSFISSLLVKEVINDVQFIPPEIQVEFMLSSSQIERQAIKAKNL